MAIHNTRLHTIQGLLLLLLGLPHSSPLGINKADDAYSSSHKPSVFSEFYPKEGIDWEAAYDFPVNKETYQLGPGDRLGIDILGQVYQGLTLDINPQNGLAFPEIGFISTKGHTISTFEKYLNTFLVGKLKFKKINIYLIRAKNQIVFISGAVENPGSQILNAPLRLNTALKIAEVKPWGKLDKIILKAGNSQTVIDYFKYYVTGDPDFNPVLPSGALVHVESCQDEGPKIFLKLNAIQTVVCAPEQALTSQLPLLFPQGFKGISDKLTLYIKRAGGIKRVEGFSSHPLSDGDTVIVTSINFRVFVSGQVNQPGEFIYSPSNSVEQYVGMAGGETWKGTFKKFYVLRDGEKIKMEPEANPLPGDVIHVPARRIPRINDIFGIVAGFTSIIISAKAIGIF